MEHNFIFNGISSEEFGLLIRCVNPYASAERAVQKHQIPGKNGELVEDLGYWHNLTLKFEAGAFLIPDHAADYMDRLMRWLQPDALYHKLTDTYNPGVFRMARFTGSFAPEQLGFNYRNFQFVIEFDCRPEKYLAGGITEIELLPAQTIALRNPTGRPAFPIIRFTKGREDLILTMPGKKVISAVYGNGMPVGREIEIDTETETAVFTGTGADANMYVSFHGDLSLPAGTTGIRAMQAETSIIPRWWRL